MASTASAVIGFLTVLVILLVVWEVVKALGGDRWQVDSFLGTGIAIDWIAAAQVRVRDGRQAAPHLGHRDRVRRRRRERTRPRWRASSARRCSRSGTRPSGSPSGSLLGLGAGDRARARAGARALARADHRGQPDHPDHRHRAAHRHRAQGRLVRRRDRVDLPDLLPGHDRRAARPPGLRPAGARADALVRGVAWRDPAQAAAAGLAAVPVHRVPHRRAGGRRRRHRRRAAVADPGRPGAPDHHRHAVLLARTRRSCGPRS